MFLIPERAFLATELENGCGEKVNPVKTGFVMILGSVVLGFTWIMDN